MPVPDTGTVRASFPTPPGGGIVAVVELSDPPSGTLDGCDDTVLMARIAGRDRDAFRVFYQRHAGRILSALRRLCRNADAIDDLLQEVFFTVWRKAAAYRSDRGDVGGWLFTITRNKVIDARRRGRLPIATDVYDDVAERPAPRERARELRLSLRQALRTLDDNQRRAVTMTYLGGFTYGETAERLEVPLGTLKSRLRRGIELLRDQLGDQET